MNFKISKRHFYQALSVVSRAVSANSPLPSLSGIKIEVLEDEICLTASDSDISIKKTIRNVGDERIFEIREKGSILIEAKYILEIVRKIDASEIDVEIIDGSLTKFSGQSSEFNINGMKASDYPMIDFSKPSNSFMIDASLLLKIITQTSFATSDRETRPVLTGVNFVCENSELETIATDSYRLAKKIVSLKEDNNFNITVPAKSLGEIAKSIEKDEEIEISVSDKKAQFEVGDTLIQTRLIDGSYPETKRLIPQDFISEVILDSRDILNAIDRASFIKNDGISIIKLNASQNEFIISSKSQEVGSSTEKISSFSYTGESLEISFSGKYVYEAIRALDATEIKISFSGEMKPFIIKSMKDDSIIQLVLPVRTYS